MSASSSAAATSRHARTDTSVSGVMPPCTTVRVGGFNGTFLAVPASIATPVHRMTSLAGAPRCVTNETRERNTNVRRKLRLLFATWTIIGGGVLVGCGNDPKPSQPTANTPKVALTAPTLGGALQGLSDALAPVARYVGAQEACYPDPACGNTERLRAITLLGTTGNALFKVANSTEPRACTDAASSLASAVVELRRRLEGREPVRAERAVARVETKAEAYAGAC